MKSKLLIGLLFISLVYQAESQGISFSYLFPKNSTVAAPISPFSIRGIGIGNIIGVETGATLYYIPGLASEDFSFKSSQPITNTHFAAMVPAELFFRIPLRGVGIKLMGGGFLWQNIATKLNEGNLDRALRDYEDWVIANSDLELETKTAFGWMAGVEFELKLASNWSLTLEGQYLKGTGEINLNGNYTGSTSSGPPETKAFDETGNLQTEGLELSIGVKILQ